MKLKSSIKNIWNHKKGNKYAMLSNFPVETWRDILLTTYEQ